MNRDFFVKLTLGVYRVTDLLPSQGYEKGEIRSLTNSVLAHLILFSETNPVTQEQKKSLVPKIQGEIGSLVGYFIRFKNSVPNGVEPKYFLILEKEYQKVAKWVEDSFLSSASSGGVAPEELPKSDLGMKKENSLSERQRKIMGILQNKEKTQVWELQKVLTEVTKRTLRRDLDDLLSLNLIERKGEWNAVFYRLKQG